MDERQAERLTSWVKRVSEELGVPTPSDITAILDVAKDAAHSVERPAAPVTTFVLGFAAAQGTDVRLAADTIARLARDFDG